MDEHVEARYEEIINHLHQALSSTEEDERDFKAKNITKLGSSRSRSMGGCHGSFSSRSVILGVY